MKIAIASGKAGAERSHYDRRVAEAYSRGRTAVDSVPGMAEAFRNLLCAVGRQLRAITGNQQGVYHAKL